MSDVAPATFCLNPTKPKGTGSAVGSRQRQGGERRRTSGDAAICAGNSAGGEAVEVLTAPDIGSSVEFPTLPSAAKPVITGAGGAGKDVKNTSAKNTGHTAATGGQCAPAPKKDTKTPKSVGAGRAEVPRKQSGQNKDQNAAVEGRGAPADDLQKASSNQRETGVVLQGKESQEVLPSPGPAGVSAETPDTREEGMEVTVEGAENIRDFPLTLSYAGCGKPMTSDRIVGGQDAFYGEWPWQISLRKNGMHICGGVMIDTQWVLSAAHCFIRPFTPSDYKVNLGAYQLSVPTGVMSEVSAIYIHPIYQRAGSSGDIALIKLMNPVPYSDYVMPICIPTQDVQFPSNLNCFVTGWGSIKSGVSLPSPQTLQKVQLPIIDRAECDAMYHLNNPTTSANTTLIQWDMICAGYKDGQKDACQVTRRPHDEEVVTVYNM
ncbi:uncharacterized protein [Phyllobates terribilis]|uniref:uncharacterized protein n=1 Tax=Phyllobates terribilis TaxID=111132 RepID=UPI003CCB4562